MNTIRMTILSTLVAGALLLSLAASAPIQDGEKKTVKVKGDAWPLSICIVRGVALDDDPVVFEHEGREVRVCCNGCKKRFLADPEPWLEAADEKIVAQQAPWYPLDTCMMSGQELDARGGPVDVVWRNRLVRFCCNGCERRFRKDPGPWIETLNAAVIEKQAKDYPLTTCIISGEGLDDMGEAPDDFVFANRLVRLCCPPCRRQFGKDPLAYIAMIDEAAAKASDGDLDPGHGDDHDRGDDHDHGDDEG